ncbi:MAG: asparagine synthase (glutamine-hydrolyzing), partial [Acidobacteriota bacterium]
ARDRLGIKPLYYALRPDGSCLFASELKAILADRGLQRELEPRAVETYFSLGYVPDPYSILRSVAKLPPAHVLRLGEGRAPRPREYWDVTFRGSTASGSGPALHEELLERLDESVRSHLVADVPLGAFLSGGIDSSAVVASMASASPEPVRTCSVRFDETAYDESPYARMVSRRFRTDHHEDRADPDCFGLLPRIVEAYDEPFSDNSALPTYLLCGLARRHVTVALSGDGGDETLGGYHRYRKFVQLAAVHRAVPEGMRAALLGAAASVAGWVGGGARGASRQASLESLRGDLVEAYERLVGISVQATRHPLYRPAFRAALQGYAAADHLRQVHRRAPADDTLSRVQYVDLKTYLPGEILTKVDRASMAHSLEVRVPLLDHRWVEWTATLPPAAKLHRGQGKHVFREALRERLPATVLDRRKKGFSIPVNGWLAGPLAPDVDERLLGPGLGEAGVLEPGAVRGLVEEHRAGRHNHGALLWALLMFQACWERLRSL